MRWLALALLVACGPGLAVTPKPLEPFHRPDPRPGTAPPSDAAGLRKLFVGEVMNGGMWFDDATCRQKFGTFGKIAPDAFDTFASCVAGLHLRTSGRTDALDDTSVLTDDHGFEIEAHVVNGRLDFIGFSGRAPGVPNLPTITPATLESLRVGGDPLATITEAEAKRIRPEGGPIGTALRLCVAETGDVSISVASLTMATTVAPFSNAIRDWKFRTFSIGETPVPVCAIVNLAYPANPDRGRLPRPPRFAKSGKQFFYVDATHLHHSGPTTIVPTDLDRMKLAVGTQIRGTFELCVDETGHYDRGEMLESTGLPNYDARIASALSTWVYQPTIANGGPIAVCAVVTFVYTQQSAVRVQR